MQFQLPEDHADQEETFGVTRMKFREVFLKMVLLAKSCKPLGFPVQVLLLPNCGLKKCWYPKVPNLLAKNIVQLETIICRGYMMTSATL